MSGIVIVKKGGSGSSIQNNFQRKLNVSYENYSGVSVMTQVLKALNQEGYFENINLVIDETETYTVVAQPLYRPQVIGWVPPIYKYQLINLGKNLPGQHYGFEGIPFTANNLELIFAGGTTADDFENLESTDKIFIEDLGGLTISQYLNNLPLTVIKDKKEGETLFKTGIAPEFITYWFIGNSGEYGQQAGPTNDLDFQLLSEFSEVVTNPIHRVLIQSKEQLLGEFRSDAVYAVDGDFEFVAGEYITLTGNATFDGWGFDISRLRKNVAGESLFKSAVGGSANLSINKLEINSGASSVFDNFDSNGTHAIEFNDVNFQGSSSLGRLKGFRQFTGTTLGFYSCGTGIQFSGTWNGVKITNTNCFAFGNGGTFFRKDVDTLFKNRFFAELNADFPLGSKLADFVESNFQSDELFQMNSSMIKYNGTIDDKNGAFLVPSLSANNRKCLWRSNVGLPDTALEKIIEDSNVSVSYVVSWLYDTYDLTMTGNTVFAETNLPASGKNTEEIKIYLQGNFTPTFPSAWNANRVGTFKIGELNQITLKYLKSGKYFMKIDNSLSVYPAPDVSSVSPSLLPDTTSLLNVYGSFFTPQSIVSIVGHIVNSVTFVNQGHLQLSVKTSILEGDFNLIVSNGTQIIKSGIVPVYLGNVFIPNEADYQNLNLLDASFGELNIQTYNSLGSADWQKEFDYTKNFSVRFKIFKSLLGEPDSQFATPSYGVRLLNATDSSIKYFVSRQENISQRIYKGTGELLVYGGVDTFEKEIEFRCVNGIVYLYVNKLLRYTETGALTNNLKLSLRLQSYNVKDIKYIELAN